MKRLSFLKKYNNEKGVAAVLVLAVILVLTALGTIALVASAANISMGSKSKSWSTEFYSLDSQAEELVQKVDAQLTIAEQDAVEYVQNRYDAMATTATAFTLSKFKTEYMMDDGTDSGAQKFFHLHYKDEWTTGGGIAITVQDYIDNTTTYPSADDARMAYENDLKVYMSDVFDRVYFHFASKRLNDLATSSPGVIPDVALVLKGGAGKYGYPDPNTTQWCTNKFIGLNVLSVWDSSTKPTDGDIVVYVLAQDAAVAGKRVETEISVIVPRYETVIQRINIPYKGNPIWANALSVQNGIQIGEGSNVRVEGDVFASATQTGGLASTTGASIHIYGNVYTAGDVHVTGNGGEINIHRYAGSGVSTDYTAKNKIFNDNDLFFTESVAHGVILSNYTENSTGSAPDGAIPFVFWDHRKWGNVYCNEFTIESGVSAGSMTAQGNLVTARDIRMDGRHSEMVIGTAAAGVAETNYIGLRSEPEDGLNVNPNESSSIINNYPYEADGLTRSSSIQINSRLFVPGVAFYEFDQAGPVWSEVGGKYYYKSAESITSRVTSPTAIFDAYMADGTDFIAPPFQRNGTKYYLTTPSGLSMKSDLSDFITSAGGIKTNIINGTSTADGYVLGVAMMQDNISSNAVVYEGIGGYSSRSYIAYNELKLAGAPLMSIFDAKTKYLGTGYIGAFENYVNKAYNASVNGFIFLGAGSHTRDISGISGIIYSEGDLTVTGNGEFKGAIICEGKLTIDGDLTIKYNEAAILSTLKNQSRVRKFFDTTIGSIGLDIDFVEEYNTTSGTRTLVKRYKVLSWKEKQE